MYKKLTAHKQTNLISSSLACVHRDSLCRRLKPIEARTSVCSVWGWRRFFLLNGLWSVCKLPDLIANLTLSIWWEPWECRVSRLSAKSVDIFLGGVKRPSVVMSLFISKQTVFYSTLVWGERDPGENWNTCKVLVEKRHQRRSRSRCRMTDMSRTQRYQGFADSLISYIAPFVTTVSHWR